MRKSKIKIITEPVVIPVMVPHILTHGLAEVACWVHEERPECFPFDGPIPDDMNDDDLAMSLFPHDGAGVTDAELGVEFAGRTCYHSYGEKAGRKSNAEYIANTQKTDIPHASIMYHPSFTFFVAGVSRRLSQELMRHNIGAERDWRGNPSQESSRYTEHVGSYVAHPRDLISAANGNPEALQDYERKCQHDYDHYLAYIDREIEHWQKDNDGKPCTGLNRKRIFESAAQRHGWGFSTSFVWTGNAVSLGKMFKEREHEASDLEFQRLAKKWREVAVPLAPNLYPQYAAKPDTSPSIVNAEIHATTTVARLDVDLSASVTAHGG